MAQSFFLISKAYLHTPFMPSSFLISLSAFAFLAYWVFGGVVFSVLSLLRPGKLRRVRFSCLYTLFSGASGYGSAYLAWKLLERSAGAMQTTAPLHVTLERIGGMGILSIIFAFLIGLCVVFVGGWIIFILSRTHELSWLDKLLGRKPQ